MGNSYSYPAHRGITWQSGIKEQPPTQSCWFFQGSPRKYPPNRCPRTRLLYSAAEYAVPAWCRISHVKNLDVTLNDTMRIVNVCLRPTPVKYIPVLSGIAPPTLRRENYMATLVKKALPDTSHLLHVCVIRAQNLGRQRLNSRRPFSRHAKSLAPSNFILMEEWQHDWHIR